jgi:hypothetical protein
MRVSKSVYYLVGSCLFVLGCDDGSARKTATSDASDASDPEQLERPEDDAAAEPADGEASQQTDAEGSEADDSGMSEDAGTDAADGLMQPRTTFESAQRVEADGPAVLTDILVPEQVDHYVFHGRAGSFYEIATDDSSYSPDLVLKLFDAERTLLATNDDGSLWPGDRFDTRLIVRLPADGDYYVRIEDPNTPAEFFQQSFRLLYYHLTLREVSAATAGFAAPTSIAFTEEARLGYRFVTVLGELEPSMNTLEFTGLDATALIARIHPGGVQGNGSDAPAGQVIVRDAQGHALSQLDRAQTSGEIRPPLGAGTYQMTLSADGELGPNPFYAVDLVLIPDNPEEQHEAENDKPAGAEQIVLSHDATGRGLLLSRLPEGDVDYYQVSVQANQQLVYTCEGERSGSGVRELRAELRDDGDALLAALEPESATSEVVTFQVEHAGIHYLRLASSTPPATSDSVEPWVRCVVIVQ